ncbi:lymphotoxin-alpha [Neoarius graeffei]|uniref:lymphotoxin-alpha n=1 Tax=Neoarius graeffei TaxID=443677 RepID=UPI00298C5B86|nr:lymphotoxin-alpha [Neoarius graeffei]
MHNQSYRFNLLVSWCFLLSISIVIMVAVIATGSNQNRETVEKVNDTGHDASTFESLRASRPSSVDHIDLVRAGNSKTSWTLSSSCFCDNTSLLLQNDSVLIKTEGLYHTYAQVTFIDSEPSKSTTGTVTLVANDHVNGKTVRKLSEAEHARGTVSMSRVILLRKDDRVKLNISPDSLILSREPSKTYWGFFLLKKQEHK